MTATIDIPKPPCQRDELADLDDQDLSPASPDIAPLPPLPRRLSWNHFLLSQLPLAAALALVAALVGFAMLKAFPAGGRWPGQHGPALAVAPGSITTFSSEAVAQQVAVSADPTGLPKWTQAAYEAKAGDVTFVVTNPSAVSHNFRVEGAGVQAQSATFGGKTTQSYTIKQLPPGEYLIVCTFAGHREAGMVAKLTVK